MSRKVVPNPHRIGEDEIIGFDLDVTNWGNYSANAVDILKDSAGSDISGTNLTGNLAVSGNIITTRKANGLTDGLDYRLEVKWDDESGNTLEAIIDLTCREED